MKSVKDFQVSGKKVLLRCSLNVPLDERGSIEDDFRLEQSIPTIEYLAEQGAKCIIIGHLGRPAAIWKIPNPKSQIPKGDSLKPIAQRLQRLLRKEIKFFGDPIGERVEKGIAKMTPGEIVMFENLRFYEGEQENSDDFGRKLARLGDLYVNDAFDVCHRENASVVAITKYLPSGVGLMLGKEVTALKRIIENPEKPMVVIVGGAKVETKASFLEKIAQKADAVLLGNLISKEIKEKMPQLNRTGKFIYATDGVPGNGKEFDLGPQTRKSFLSKIKEAKTIFWAGPLGMVEKEEYEKGSLQVAQAIIESGAFAVAGGGDLAAFLGKHNLRNKFSHVSTGGGAMLAFLAGEKLPGLEVLKYGAD